MLPSRIELQPMKSERSVAVRLATRLQLSSLGAQASMIDTGPDDILVRRATECLGELAGSPKDESSAV